MWVSNEFNVAFWSVNGECSTPVVTIVGDQIMIGNCFHGENVWNPLWVVPDRKISKHSFLVGSCAASITVDNDWLFDGVDVCHLWLTNWSRVLWLSSNSQSLLRSPPPVWWRICSSFTHCPDHYFHPLLWHSWNSLLLDNVLHNVHFTAITNNVSGRTTSFLLALDYANTTSVCWCGRFCQWFVLMDMCWAKVLFNLLCWCLSDPLSNRAAITSFLTISLHDSISLWLAISMVLFYAFLSFFLTKHGNFPRVHASKSSIDSTCALNSFR